jgi:small-conductance mechanosensitive channel
MQKTQRIIAIVLALLVLASIYGVWATRQPRTPKRPNAMQQQATDDKSLVDQTPLKTAQQLAQLATTYQERPLAQEALRLADLDVNLAFDNALRQARLHPPPLSVEAKVCEARLQKAEKLLKADQERAMDISEAQAKATDKKKDALQADLIQAQADIELDRDEVDDARQDLIRAGGDVTDRIDALRKSHEETAKNTPSAIPNGQESVDKPGLIHRIAEWRQLHQKQMQLWRAKSETEEALAVLSRKHDALDAQIDQEKAAIPELSHHSKKAAADAGVAYTSAAQRSQEDTATLLSKTKEFADNQKVLATFDKRMDTKRELAAVYAQWIETVAAHQRVILNRALLGVAIILVIALIGIYVNSWIDSVIAKVSVDRRQVASLRTVTRVSLQVVALCMILLVLLGPPGQIGTFLGLAGAGLTVALKDFIIAFLGWFVLMGKNGIRLGDWVEINGVTGEVVQIGPFHTVLMETGNWTDSGHPTGRRVTFTNGYAIEGHYFNFSTTGQWLWDELQVVLPAGQDPYPIVDAIHKKVLEATRESGQLAAEEWHKADNSRELSGISVEPAIGVKPVVGGIELSVRYISRATERYKLRAQLYQDIIGLLGGKTGTLPAKLPEALPGKVTAEKVITS